MEITVIIDNVRSAYNIGSIFRSCDGAGVKKIYICGISPTPEHIKVAKTALGSEDYIIWEYFRTTKEAIQKAKDYGFKVWALETDNTASDFQKVKYPEKIAFVVGHETEGINSDTLALCDDIVQIPMRGSKNSLNVSNALSILIYEATR